MSSIAEELDRTLRQLDRATAERVEQLVRDALSLVGRPVDAQAASRWPEGYFARTAGALAGEQFER